MTNANELYKAHIDYTWIRPGAMWTTTDYGDIVQEDWFINTLIKHGNPFCQKFMADVFECLETIPQIFDLDNADAEDVLDNYFHAYFADGLAHTLHEVEYDY